MKILLQPEARTISNKELVKNQEFLLEIFTRVAPFKLKPQAKTN